MDLTLQQYRNTIAFASLKGGVGKTSLAILTANWLASAGYRVLFVDLDIQNAASFYYLDDHEPAETKNIARAFHDDSLEPNILTSNYAGVDLIASSFHLVDLRAIGTKRLGLLLGPVEDQYDYIVIDTAPGYDNISLNAINAAHQIITPVFLTQFDWKNAVFLRDHLQSETDKYNAWRILFNKYTPPRSDNPDTLTNQYLALFHDTFDNILPVQIPESKHVQRAIDTGEVISTAKAKERLFEAIGELVQTITGIRETVERF